MTERTFQRRRGGLVNLLYLEIDDQPAREIRAALPKGRFDVAEQAIARQKDSNERLYYLEAAADWHDDAPFLREWAASGSATGRLAAAIHALKRSWNHSNWTHGPKDQERFFAELRAANGELTAIAKASPRDATPFYWMIWAARALWQAERARALYAEAVRRDPTLLASHVAGLWTDAPQWFGSEDKALELARHVAATAPKGLGANMLIVEAHWHAAGLSRGERWTRPEVRDEVLAADERDRQSPATGINRMRSHQWFAYGLWAIGQPALAKDRFAAIGKASNEHPWSRARFGLDIIYSPYRKARKASRRR